MPFTIPYGNTLWIFGDVADDAVKGGNAGDQADIKRYQIFSKSDNGVLNTFGESTYETISRANNAITNIRH